MLLTTKRWDTTASFDHKDTEAVLDVLLKERNIITPEDREAFMLEGDGVWHDPFLFKDMDKAVDMIVGCIRSNEKIVVYGDYDCDGVTATAILVRYFRSHNCNVDYIVPHRAEHGYGLTDNIIDKVLELSPDLLITVDCGITNLDTVAQMKEHGIKVIVTDHHNVKDELPAADAVICAKREDNTYPFRDLCGAGVACKLIEALGRDKRCGVTSGIWRQAVEMAGIATIADLVSVVDENRTIIKKAFRSMRNAVNPGVRIMNAIITDTGKRLDETLISFNFVPRINAAGRLYDSSDALKLFLEDDEALVRKAAEALGQENEERKKIEAKVFEEAVAQIEAEDRPEEWLLTNTTGPVVVYGADWHQGVLGIVAGKLSQYYRRTAIVFTNDSIDTDNVKGSGRAYGEYDLFGALEKVSDLCVNFGGHKKAAGLVVAKNKLGTFMKTLEENSREGKDRAGAEDKSDNYEDEDCLKISADIPFEQVDFETYERINVLKPFGIGNRKPIFSTTDLVISELSSMSDGAHMRVDLIKPGEGSDGKSLSVVGFGMGQYLNIFKVGDHVDIAYTMNEFPMRGTATLSLHLEDIRYSAGGEFIWEKADIAESLYAGRMELDQIAKLVKDREGTLLVPTKEQYAACYKVLSDKCRTGISTVETTLMARMITINSGVEITPFQFRRCMDVFSEAGLIKLGVLSPTRICFSFLPNETKAKLSDTPTYQRLGGT